MVNKPHSNGSKWQTVALGEQWLSQFRSFKSSAFRLEVLQEYAEPSEADAFELFKREGVVPGTFIADWCNLVRSHVEQGRSMSRIHIVEVPLSEYLRFEIEGAYARTSQAGERILLLERGELSPELLAAGSEDFWLFDESRVMVQHYSEAGRLLHSRLTTDSDLVSYYWEIRNKLLLIAKPFDEMYERLTGRKLNMVGGLGTL